EKVVEQHEIGVEIDEELDLADGYEILEPTLSNNLVNLSGAASTMASIDKVIVEISSSETEINDDILQLAPVLVLDEEGNPLNVNADPSQVEILAPVVRTQKEVPIVLRKGSGATAGYSYEVSLSNAESESVIVRGEPEAVEELSNFPITVNFDNITESTLKTVPIGSLPEGIEEINKDEVEVLIEVTENDSNNSIED
ncbi:MAG TPA: CdaR family protein, partial [Atopostipes sp.]|nr:CdaR family protein [Atopostipes sp.]